MSIEHFIFLFYVERPPLFYIIILVGSTIIIIIVLNFQFII